MGCAKTSWRGVRCEGPIVVRRGAVAWAPLATGMILASVVAWPLSLVAQSPSLQDILSMIDEGQKHNRQLAPRSGRGLMTRTDTRTADGLKLDLAELTAAGRELPGYLQGDLTRPQVRSQGTAVTFDGERVKWDADGVRYSYDGSVIYEMLMGKLPRAYIRDPAPYLAAAGDYSPRSWFYGKVDGSLLSYLGESRNAAGGVTSKEVARTEGSLYEVTLRRADGCSQTMRIDPRKGYEVVEAWIADEKGNVLQRSQYELIQAMSGGWVPKKWMSTYYAAAGANGEVVPTRIFTSEFDEIAFGPIDPKAFSLADLGLPNGTQVYDMRIPGKPMFIYGVSASQERAIEEMVRDALVNQVLAEADAAPGASTMVANPASGGTEPEESSTRATVAVVGHGIAAGWWLAGALALVGIVVGGTVLVVHRVRRSGGTPR